MLNDAQIAQFHEQGFLVIPQVVPQSAQRGVRDEYAELMDRLYEEWHAQGLVDTAPDNLTFWDKLRLSYEAGCDWFQPMDISLPGETIYGDTPMHFGPAVFDLATKFVY